MNWHTITGYAIWTPIVLWIVYDVCVECFVGNDATISRTVLGWAQRWPITVILVTAVFVGLLVHFFDPVRQHVAAQFIGPK